MGSDVRLTVTEAAAACGIGAHALRFYERAGVLVGVPRDGSGRRAYGPTELRAVRFVVRLRATGMPVREIKRYADLVRAGTETEGERLGLLLEHRAALQRSLLAQQEHLAAIDRKIADYRRHGAGAAQAASGVRPEGRVGRA